eukprot:6188878-Pyramimonas_sp.AAC.1
MTGKTSLSAFDVAPSHTLLDPPASASAEANADASLDAHPTPCAKRARMEKAENPSPSFPEPEDAAV